MPRTGAERVRTALAAVARAVALVLTAGTVVASAVSTTVVAVAVVLLVGALALYAWDSPSRSLRRPRASADPRSTREQRLAAMLWAACWAPGALLVIDAHSWVVTLVVVVALVGLDPLWLWVARRRTLP